MSLMSQDDLLLSNWILTYIGDISYSLYLIHWPICAYFRMQDQVDNYGNDYSNDNLIWADFIKTASTIESLKKSGRVIHNDTFVNMLSEFLLIN